MFGIYVGVKEWLEMFMFFWRMVFDVVVGRFDGGDGFGFGFGFG